MNHLTRCKGCLIGGAIGDALGYPIEFMSQESIFYKYGHDGLTDYVLTYLPRMRLSALKTNFPNNG